MDHSIANCGWRLSAADRARSSAECMPPRRFSTTALNWLPERCRAIRSAQKPRPPITTFSPDRAYGSYRELIESETKLPPEKRVDFISIATPNDTHFEIAKLAVEAGFNVICDKPLTVDLNQAEQLAAAVDKSGVVFALTHNYTGYPLVRHAQDMIRRGELGEINAIRVAYIQGWLRTRLDLENQKQATWRADPKKSGAAGSFGDIGTHAFNLARYMTGLLPESISAQLKTFVPGRELDDYGTALVRFENGALGTITASQISHGRENDLRIEIDGTERLARVASGRAEQNVAPPQRPAAPANHAEPECRRHERSRQSCVPLAGRASGRIFRSVRQRVPRGIRQYGAACRRKGLRKSPHHLSQHRRRRGRDVLPSAICRQQQTERRLAAAEACKGKKIISLVNSEFEYPTTVYSASGS